MTLGLMSDIHGNATALQAVLEDASSVGVDEWWVLGDPVALGPEPVAVLETLAELPTAEFIAGNTERYALSGARPFPRSLTAARPTPSSTSTRLSIASSTTTAWVSWRRSIECDILRAAT